MDSIVHFEIPAKDTKRAKNFYTKLFGWKMNEIPEMSYTIVHTTEVGKDMMPMKPGAINGGLYKGEGAPTLVINVKSIDASVSAIGKAGGKITAAKRPVGDMGYYAKFKDTEGNELGLWEMMPPKKGKKG